MPYPISNICPQCGSPRFKAVPPEAYIAFQSDRVCTDCESRYTPPTPRFGGMLITASGVLILGVTLYSDLSGLGRLSALSIFWGPIGVAALLYGLRYIISPTKPIAVAESRVMSTIGNAATDFVKLVAYAVLWMIFSLASVPAAGFGAGFLFEVLVPEKSISKAHVESGPDDVAQDEILAEQQVTAHARLAERQREIAHAIWLGQQETAFVTGFGAAFVGNILLYILYYARFKPRLRN